MSDFSDKMNLNEKQAFKKFIDERGSKSWFLATQYFYINDNTRVWYSGNDYPNIWAEIRDPVEGWVTVNGREGPWQEEILAMGRELGKSQQERLETAYKYKSPINSTRFDKVEID